MNSGKENKFYDNALFGDLQTSSPAGDYVRYDAIFDELKENRREFLEQLKSQGLGKELTLACGLFRNKVIDLLCNKSKDFVLVFWLIECTTIIDLYEGIESSALFLVEFLQRFWNVAHPFEDGYEMKLLSLQWFDKEFANTLKFLHLFGKNSEYRKNFSKNKIDHLNNQFELWEKTSSKAMTRDQKSKHAEFKVEWEQYKAFCSALNVKSLSDNLARLKNCTKNFKEAETTIDGLVPDAPRVFEKIFVTLRSIENILEGTIEHLKDASSNLAKDQDGDTFDQAVGVQKALSTPSNSVTTETISQKGVDRYITNLQDKNEVYELMSSLVERLSVLDPSSPNVQLGKKMLRIKDMTFLDILEELVDDKRARDHVIRFFGIRDDA